MKKLLLPILALCLCLPTFAQINTPAASPSAKIMQTVGLTDITVEYSRPSAKGRTIFAKDGLVPFGTTWRTGANAATKITFDGDVTFAGVEVAGGSYALLTKPDQGQWEIMLFPYEGRSWGSYADKEAAASVTVKPMTLSQPIETFSIGFDHLTMDGGHLTIGWADTQVNIEIGAAVHESVMSDIKRTMAGPSMNDYYQAASYLHQSEGDLGQALEYIKQATDVEEPRFWMVRREALILADLDRTQEAIAAAKRSMELAKAAGNEDYVRMNEKSIAEWME